MYGVILQAGVNINDLAIIGVGAVIVIMLIGALAQVGLSYLAQQSLGNQISLGMQAIVGSNNLRIVDQQQDDGMQDGNGGGGNGPQN